MAGQLKTKIKKAAVILAVALLAGISAGYIIYDCVAEDVAAQLDNKTD